MCQFSQRWLSGSFKVTSNDTASRPHEFLTVFHYKYDRILYHFQVLVACLWKDCAVAWPLSCQFWGQIVVLRLALTSPVYVPGLKWPAPPASKIVWAAKEITWLWPRPLGVVRVARMIELDVIVCCILLGISCLCVTKITKAAQNIPDRMIGKLGITQGHWKCHHSIDYVLLHTVAVSQSCCHFQDVSWYMYWLQIANVSYRVGI